MKTIMKIGALFLILLLPALCEAGPKLSEDEAIKLIENNRKNELLVTKFIDIGDDNNTKTILDTMVRDKLIVYAGKEGFPESLIYKPTETGKQYIDGDIRFRRCGVSTKFTVFIQKGEIRIKEILTDENNDTARVEYIIVYKTINEPFVEDLLIKGKTNRVNQGFGPTLVKNEIQSIELKKYDKGWRVMKKTPF